MTAPTPEHPRYQLTRLIATGGMGEVWSATDTLLDREVAVKVLKQEYAQDPVFRARFAAEARHAGSLQHPHVAAVLDYGELSPGDAPVPFLVMELVEGRSLSALLAPGEALEPQVAADLVAQAAEGIAAAHGLGIVHRDVKPGNLLVTEQGQLKVTDFGVARAADTVPLTVTGHIVGTPHYLSPEQAQGQAATAASDVYSLGIVLYECLSGRKPFVGESPVATALMHVRDPLPAFPGAVPRRLQDITRVATAKDPAARYSSAAAFAAALRDETPDTRTFVMPGEAAAEGPAPDERPAAVAASTTVSAGADPARRPVLRSASVRVLGAVVALVVLAGAGWAVSTRDDQSPGAAAATESDRPDRPDRPTRVRLRAAAYLGLPVTQATRRLDRQGFTVTTRARENPGAALGGVVAGVSPHGLVERGSRVLLTIWSDPPPPVVPPSGALPSSGGSGGGARDSDGADGAGSSGATTAPSQAGKGKADKATGNGNGDSKGKGKSNGKGKGKSGGKGHKADHRGGKG